MEHLAGRNMTTHDVITGGPINALLSMTGLPAVELVEGVAAPPLAYWLFCRDEPPMQALGTDGHRSIGGLLPTPALHRRMWAGGHLEFFRPIRLGAAVTRRSQVVTSEERAGRTGKLTIVQLRCNFDQRLFDSQEPYHAGHVLHDPTSH